MKVAEAVFTMLVSPVTPTADQPSAFKLTRRRMLWIGVAIGFVVTLTAGGVFVSANWPYGYRKIHPLLEEVLSSQVKVSEYHRTYFPHPGFVAIGLTLRRKTAPDLPPLGSVEKMVVQGRWTDLLLLRRRVQIVDITNLHIVVPPIGSRANQEDFPPGSAKDFGGPETAIENLRIHSSVLDIMRKDGGRFSFPIHELDLRNFEQGQAMQYEVDMDNAKPRGRIRAHGSLGPLTPVDLGKTPVTGDFTFASVDLHDVGDIHGTLSSAGHFKGTLSAMEADATSDTPDFAVGNGRPTRVGASIQCTVNGMSGDVAIHRIEAKLGTTILRAAGAIAGSPKITNLDITVDSGRAEDVLRPFMQKAVPIAGPVRLNSHAYIGPSGEPFLKRLRVNGVFDVPSERLTDKKTEKSISDFSQRAQGMKSQGPDGKSDDESAASPADAFSSIKGAAEIRDGIISSRHLVFQVDGAEANLSGTFALHGQIVHLVGDLKMESDISHTATGFKSFLLKPLAPFFKKRNTGAVVPIAVTGGPGSYKVSQNISHDK